jgi:hypothetical protein
MSKRSILVSLLLALVASLPATGAAAGRVSPAQLTAAGWDCILPPPEFNPNVHCAKPGSLEGILSAEAEMVVWLAFATSDLESTSAALLGSERMIRADLFHGQPCPTDPPSYEYSWLMPRFGWDYYICHTFDSPW